MKNVKMHHNDDLDHTKGSWRPALVAGIVGADGNPETFNEIVVFSCPGCGAPQGVGADDVKILPSGETDKPVHCHHCSWSDVMTFDKFSETDGRDKFAKAKDKAKKEVDDGRIHIMSEHIHNQMLLEMKDKVEAEAKKLIPDNAPNKAELFKDFMKKKGLMN